MINIVCHKHKFCEHLFCNCIITNGRSLVKMCIRDRYKALAQAQVGLLESESFNIEAASFEAFENLQTSAAEHYDQINASAMYQNQTPVKMTSEDEELSLIHI